MSDSLLETVRARLSTLWSPARFGLFAGVGLIGASVDMIVLVLLVGVGPLGPAGGKVGSWIVAIAVIFAINERFTFAEFGLGGPRATLRRLIRSYAVRSGGFLVTLAVLSALYYGFGVWYVAANAVGMGVGFFVNYAAESLYTWRVHRGRR